tara:strand:+ start:338 stop:1063 length:726 start_codon:yes stop_codon:yes gene_type:complete
MIKMYFTKTGRPIKPYPKPKNSKRFKNLTGKTFGRLKVVKYLGRCYHSNNTNGFSNHWAANCSCGKKDVVVATASFRKGTQSCGCLADEQRRERAFVHGGRGSSNEDRTATYVTWFQMRSRCNNQNNKDFKNYGERGIVVCDSWGQFKNFLADMGERPPHMTLDRIDNDGNYAKDNCRWATRKEQCRNTRVNHIVEFNGRKQPIVVWAEEYNINARTLRTRIVDAKWSIKKALTTPVRKNR